ncbi:hypothetical protein ABEB36_010372 [Hypothenemus hampei]|uniref:Tetraspanin n=1 Tax=Hypothenemus hampei TaxID=57062 RepID=A0ABD1EJH5_HYPHA
MGKPLQTVVALVSMKAWLLLFNFIFLISGIVILSIGIWLQKDWGINTEMNYEPSGAPSYVLMGIGSLIVVISSLACCCTPKGQPALLYVYGAFIAIICILEMGIGVSMVAYRTQLSEEFGRGLNFAMSHYKSVNNSKMSSEIDLIQKTIHCCGYHNARDWLNLPHKIPIPNSCCIKENCNTEEDAHEIYTEGCYEKIIDFVNNHVVIVAGVVVGISAFPLIGVFLACCLASVINKTKYELIV